MLYEISGSQVSPETLSSPRDIPMTGVCFRGLIAFLLQLLASVKWCLFLQFLPDFGRHIPTQTHTYLCASTHTPLSATPSLALPATLVPLWLQCLLKLDKNAGLARCEGAAGGSGSQGREEQEKAMTSQEWKWQSGRLEKRMGNCKPGSSLKMVFHRKFTAGYLALST